jgi:lipoprotein-anchoring transpeptidase ErfK/SrfK
VKTSVALSVLILAVLALGGCSATTGTTTASLHGNKANKAYAAAYTAPRAEPVTSSRDPWTLQTPFGILYSEVPREHVAYTTNEPPGSIIVDTPHRYLYYVVGKGRAIRYSIAVGAEGYGWRGVTHVSQKREWPDWTPTPGELKRFPDLPRHMDGGPQNPLGARALYLGSTLYRIHGTNEPWKIGAAVSSGCIRMSNNDAIDLYNRTKVGATVVVR